MAKPADRYQAGEIESLVKRLAGRQRLLVWGEMGIGKSTLALNLLPALTRRFGPCQLLELDPGSPPLAVPGALCRLSWQESKLSRDDCQPLCSLDAARFRLPLIQAARVLAGRGTSAAAAAPLLVDPPGVTRGVGGAELLVALAESLQIDTILALHRPGRELPLAMELKSLAAEIVLLTAHPGAKKPSDLQRLKHRTALWDRFLQEGEETELPLAELTLLGTPPPPAVPAAWGGRQAALLDRYGRPLAMGEVRGLSGSRLGLRLVRIGEMVEKPASLLIRDAGRDPAGRLATIPPRNQPPALPRAPAEMTPPLFAGGRFSPPVSSHCGPAWATLTGGVFGDPLLHVRLRHRKTGFFFDLGDPARLLAKMAHQVRCVFLSHCHLDHVCGFLWFLRSRIGPFPPCTVFGPQQTIARLESFIQAVTWDRIEEAGPVFEVCEIGGGAIKRARLQPGQETIARPPLSARDNALLRGDDYLVKAAVLDHQIPSIAYALIFHDEIKVRKDRLEADSLPPGLWLGNLKAAMRRKDRAREIELPDGSRRPAGVLAEELLLLRPGKKLVYATDLADTGRNREKLIELATGAHTLFCEASFAAADRDKAQASQHLTTRAAVAIARAAGVERLVPFHFSKRYERNPQALYEEMAAMAGPVRIIGRPAAGER